MRYLAILFLLLVSAVTPAFTQELPPAPEPKFDAPPTHVEWVWMESPMIDRMAWGFTDHIDSVPPAGSCNAHRRKLKNPFTWLESNMCDDDWEKWAAPRRHPFWKDKIWWVGVGVIAVSQVLDSSSTARGFPKGFVEGNFFLGPHPSNERLAGYTATYFTGQVLLHAWAYHESHLDPSKTWRIIGQWGMPGASFGTVGVQGIKNYRLESR